MEEKNKTQQPFDVRVYIESFDKAKEVKEVVAVKHKLKLSDTDLKDIATTLFIQSMHNIAESKKNKVKKEEFY